MDHYRTKTQLCLKSLIFSFSCSNVFSWLQSLYTDERQSVIAVETSTCPSKGYHLAQGYGVSPLEGSWDVVGSSPSWLHRVPN